MNSLCSSGRLPTKNPPALVLRWWVCPTTPGVPAGFFLPRLLDRLWQLFSSGPHSCLPLTLPHPSNVFLSSRCHCLQGLRLWHMWVVLGNRGLICVESQEVSMIHQKLGNRVDPCEGNLLPLGKRLPQERPAFVSPW